MDALFQIQSKLPSQELSTGVLLLAASELPIGLQPVRLPIRLFPYDLISIWSNLKLVQ